MEELSHHLPDWLAAIVVPALTIGAVCWKGDELISDEARRAIAGSLKNPVLERLPERASILISEIIDYVYGRNHFSFKCMRRVFIISQLTSLLVFLYIFHRYIRLTYTELLLLAVAFPSISVLYLILTMFVNFVSDYISIFKTRYLVFRVSSSGSFLLFLFLPIIDILFTFFIFAIILQLMSVEIPIFVGLGRVLVDVSPEFRSMLFNGPPTQIMILSMFIASSITSLWILLFSITMLIIYSLMKTRTVLQFFVWLLPIGEKPLRSIGIAGSIVALAAISAASVVKSIFLD
jgi:hypothetical protein